QSLRHLARVQTNLGVLYYRMNRGEPAMEMMVASTATLEKILKMTSQPAQHQGSLAGAYVKMGGMSFVLFNRADEGIAYMKKGIQLLEVLASKYRGLPGYRIQLANAHTTLA